MNLATLHVVLVATGFLLAVVGVIIALLASHRLAGMDSAALSARLFMHGREARRFIVIFGVGVLLFVWMPFAELGELLTDVEHGFAILHDVAHLLFIAVAVAGLVGLIRVLRRDGGP